MSKKYDEVLKIARNASTTDGKNIPETFIKEFESAVKDGKQDSKVIKSTAETLLKWLYMLNQRQPGVSKAVRLVCALTQTSGSSAGSQRSSQGSSYVPKARNGKATAPTKGDKSPSASTPFKGVEGKGIGTTPAAGSTPNRKGTIGDHGQIFNQFVSELNLILSFKQDQFTDKTIAESSSVIKDELKDLLENIIQLKIRKSEREEVKGDALSKKLVALREAILKESYASPKNEVTQENDPDERVFTVIQTELSARLNTMLEIEKDLKDLEEQLSFDNKPSTTRLKDSGKLPLQRIKDHVSKLDKLVNNRMQAVQLTNDRQIETIYKQLRQLECQVAGERNKENEQLPTLNSIQHTVQTLEGLLKKPAQPVGKNMEGNKVQTTHIEIAEVNSQLDEMEKRLIAPYQKQDPSRKHMHEARNLSPAMKSNVVRSIKVMVEEIEKILLSQDSEIHWHKDIKRENERKISEMLAEAEQLRAEKDELFTRLSSISGAKLVEHNPNIADLSDPNRPTKLAEKYKEMYDTEWTDAYEALEKEFTYEDKECCTALVKILMDVYDRCTDIAKTQASGIRRYLINPTANPNDLPKDLKEQVTDSVRSEMIADLRKQTADISVKNIIKGFPKYDELFNNKTICKYRNRCIEICWFMSLQTPLVVLERPPTGKVKFDKTKYTEYKKKGATIDFVTLPPMLLQENGALLCKGIAQGK